MMIITNNNNMAPLASSNSSIVDYNAGLLLLDSSSFEHSTVDCCHKKQSSMLMMEHNDIMMDASSSSSSSSFHNSAPCGLDLKTILYLEQAIAITAATTDPTPKSSSSRSSSSVKRSVRFADYDQIHPIDHRNDMTQEDMDAMYLSADEQTAAKQSAFQELVASVHGEISMEEDAAGTVCLRGLENHLLENSQRFRETVHKLYDVVYDCQTFEDENGVAVPPEYLREYMVHISSYCADEARERAMRDAQEAASVSALECAEEEQII